MTERTLGLLKWLFPPIAPAVTNTAAFAVVLCLVGAYVAKAIDVVTLGCFTLFGATAGMLIDWNRVRRNYAKTNRMTWDSVADPASLIFRWLGLGVAWISFTIVPALVGNWAFQAGQDKGRDAREQLEMTDLISKAKAHSSRREYPDAVRVYTEAIVCCEKAAHTGKQEKATNLLARLYEARALDNERAKNRTQAIADLDKAISLNEDSATAHYWRGMFHFLNQDLGMAMKDCDRSLTLRQSNPLAHLLRGDINSSKLEWDHAIAAYTEAIKLDGKLSDAFTRRAVAYQAKGNQMLAAADLEEAGRIAKAAPKPQP